MNRRFDDILDECVEQVLRGESVEQCLQRYPEQARELEPLLRVAAAGRETSSAVVPRPEFKARGRQEIQSRLRSPERKAGGWRTPAIGWVPRWAAVAVSLAFVLILSGTATVAASTDALPGDTLYPVKTATEEVQLKLTFSEDAKARLEARFAERRVREMVLLAEAGQTERLRSAGARFAAHLTQIEEVAAQIEQADPEDGERISELRATLYANMARDLTLLDAAEDKAPSGARSAIAVAKFRLMEKYEKAIAALDELQNGQADTGSSAGAGADAQSEDTGGSNRDGQAGSAGSGQQSQGTGMAVRPSTAKAADLSGL